jgi:hypothetical protein
MIPGRYKKREGSNKGRPLIVEIRIKDRNEGLGMEVRDLT